MHAQLLTSRALGLSRLSPRQSESKVLQSACICGGELESDNVKVHADSETISGEGERTQASSSGRGEQQGQQIETLLEHVGVCCAQQAGGQSRMHVAQQHTKKTATKNRREKADATAVN